MGYTTADVWRPRHASTAPTNANRARTIITKTAAVAGLALATFFGVKSVEHMVSTPRPVVHEVAVDGHPDLTDHQVEAYGVASLERGISDYVDLSVGVGAFGALVLGGVSYAAKRDHDRRYGYHDDEYYDEEAWPMDNLATAALPDVPVAPAEEHIVELPVNPDYLLTPNPHCAMLDLLEPTI